MTKIKDLKPGDKIWEIHEHGTESRNMKVASFTVTQLDQRYIYFEPDDQPHENDFRLRLSTYGDRELPCEIDEPWCRNIYASRSDAVARAEKERAVDELNMVLTQLINRLSFGRFDVLDRLDIADINGIKQAVEAAYEKVKE